MTGQARLCRALLPKTLCLAWSFTPDFPLTLRWLQPGHCHSRGLSCAPPVSWLLGSGRPLLSALLSPSGYFLPILPRFCSVCKTIVFLGSLESTPPSCTDFSKGSYILMSIHHGPTDNREVICPLCLYSQANSSSGTLCLSFFTSYIAAIICPDHAGLF